MDLKNKIKHFLLKFYKKYKKATYKGKNIYLIYSMGKVGSASIYKTLIKRKPYSAIFHVHFLSKNWLEHRLPKANTFFHSNIEVGRTILKYIKRNPKKRIKIITLVREPVIRAISELFQNWESSFEDIESIQNDVLENHINKNGFNYTLNWFDTEFLEYTNIDIYQLNFNKNNGFGIYKFDRFDILCIKLEALNEVGNKAFKEFLGADLNLISANKSLDKKGKEKYQYLKNNLKINKEELAELYQSKYVSHFYTEDEINSFIKKWSK